MFENLTEKLDLTFKKLRGQGKISENHIREALREVRLALLEADVNFHVVKRFMGTVQEKSLGQEVLRSLSPDQQFLKIVREELRALLGGEPQELSMKATPPLVFLLVGLQGSGKTTTAAKLALYLKREKKRAPYLVSADTHRPAAIDQLKILGRQLEIPVHETSSDDSPIAICQKALLKAQKGLYDVLLIDTAGRLHIDAELMEEMRAIRDAVRPHATLFVADAMTGQDAVQQARGFNEWLGIDGMILTKMDGDARGGAALSIREVLGIPLLFAGIGEKPDALEPIFPDRLASRILGMGDVLSLIEKAEKAYEKKELQRLEKVAKSDQFSLEDFQSQLHALKKMGSIGEVFDLIPGGKKLLEKVNVDKAEGELKRVGAIISSMTNQERRNPTLLNGSRRRRIAQGSGTTVTEVNRLMKQFLEMKKIMSRMRKGGGRTFFRGIPRPF